eukprot:CAMPEP_0183307702 /NCGR_PEP_ID=MMETSP0160_2-20130417/18839_1 /TAXON_ID=2839 ORGANISM="Odontella Sinensis, Strain Grunow 1884" /NCGR_SAMPLE_ID=MMETSP0160_2 /ASSEMBLY_ACC=CAM_ASM_000250 /LENGTH=59 /DNA_ID=CAMNT_0025471347 /DNA_START=131 /DNA_END=307 /DNA_ORIENTATION=+
MPSDKIIATKNHDDVLAFSPTPPVRDSVPIRGDCYDVRDMYGICVRRNDTGSGLCDAVV